MTPGVCIIDSGEGMTLASVLRALARTSGNTKEEQGENMVKKCVKCGGTKFRESATPLKQVVDGREFTGSLRTRTCESCSEGYVDLSDGKRYEMDVARDLAVGAGIGPEGFRYMRKALGMKAEQLATLLDVARETLSRWETGDREIPRMAWALLAGIVLEGSTGSSPTLSRLVDFKEPPKLAKTNVAGELAARRA